VFIAVISIGQWKSWVRACGLQQEVDRLQAALALDFAREGDRYQARESIAEAVEQWCAARTLAEIGQVFDAEGVCWNVYQTVREALRDDPRVGSANPVFERLQTAGVGEQVLLLEAGADALDRHRKVLERHLLRAAARRGERGLVAQVGEVGAREASGQRRELMEIDAVGEADLLRVHLKDRHAARLARRPRAAVAGPQGSLCSTSGSTAVAPASRNNAAATVTDQPLR
jgi:hypothetical protein